MIHKNFITFFLIFIFFIIISFFLANYVGLDRHWSSIYDQELTLAYNALLFNNGLKIEYLDHPGYFSILFLSLFIKIFSILDFISIDKLSLINKENFDQSFQEILIYTRVYSALIFSFLNFTYFLLAYTFSKNKIFSFFFSLIFLITPGNIFHVTQLRTESLAFIFVLISLIFLKKFFENNQNRILYLVGFILFLYCSLLNKMQIFFLFPFFLIIFFSSKNKIDDFNLENFKFVKNKIMPLILFTILISFIYIPNNTLHPFPLLSGLAVIIFIFIFNLFFFVILKNTSKNLRYNLVFINLVFVFVILIVNNLLLIHPSTNEIIFINLTRIMHLAQYVPNIPEIDDFYNLLVFLINNFFKFSLNILRNEIFQLNLYSFLIFANLLLIIIYNKSLTKKNIVFNLSCILVAILIMIINSYRLNGNLLPQYYIFSNFFLIFSFYNFKKLINYKYFIIIFVISFFINFQSNEQILKKTKNNKNKVNELCDSSYFFTWHKKVDKEYFKNFCNKSNQY